MPQFGGSKKPATGIVYDSDLGGTIDSVLALALLHGFEGKTEARIAGLTIGNPSLKSAQLCDVIEKFYQSAITGLAATFFTGAPIGLATNGKEPGETPIMTALLAKKDDSGKPVYAPRIRKLNDTAIPEVLIRNALSAQYDQNAIVVLAGPPTNLVKLLDLRDTKELIQSKVKFLVISEQAATDPVTTKRLLAEWPTPIFVCGREVGEALPFPGSSIEKDFAYAPAHPVAAAYRAYQPMPYDAPATDMAAVLYAARPKGSYFKLSEPGTIGVSDDAHLAFRASESGKHRRLILDPAQKEEILKIYTTFASAKPVARTFRIPVADDKKADEKDGKQ